MAFSVLAPPLSISVVQIYTLQELAQSSVHTDKNELVQVHNLQF